MSKFLDVCFTFYSIVQGSFKGTALRISKQLRNRYKSHYFKEHAKIWKRIYSNKIATISVPGPSSNVVSYISKIDDITD